MRRRRARAAALVAGAALVFACAGPVASPVRAVAAAGAGDQFSIVDVPDEAGGADAVGVDSPTTFARLHADEVDRIASASAPVRQALTRRPAARTVLRFDAAHRRWVATVRERDAQVDLARVTVDDRTARVIGSYTLPEGEYPPLLTPETAIQTALADRRLQRTARQFGGVAELHETARYTDSCCWNVDFFPAHPTHGHPAGDALIQVDIDDASGSVTGVWTGIKIAWKMARGGRSQFGGYAADLPFWLPLFVLFALVAIDWTRLRSWANTDVAALLALGLSHEAFVRGDIDWSVPLAVPPLAWLLARMLLLAARGLPRQRPPYRPVTPIARLALRRVPTAALVVLCVALAGARIGVTLTGGNVIDVGAAGVDGARLELHGRAVWGNMPSDNPSGDTYGPLNYFAYVPATALLDDPGRDRFGEEMPAATWTSIAADLLCVVLLAVIGWRWISRRGAVLLALGWLACPWTNLAMASGVNDALVAAPMLLAFALLRRPTLRGVALGAAVLVKFAPLAVVPAFVRVGSTRRLRQTLLTCAGGLVVLAAGAVWVVYRIPGSTGHALRLFEQRTVTFQAQRGSPFSPWGLYGWHTAQHVAQLVVAVALLWAFVLPRPRDAWQVAAGAAAALIAAELVLTHWFYLYVPWFAGFVLITLVATRERPVPGRSAPSRTRVT